MADLFKIQIMSIEGTKCVVKLNSMHPHQLDIPCIENVAFQIVVEAYKEFGPFSSHPWKEKMDRWLSYLYRQEIPISAEEYKNYDTGNTPLPPDCSGLGNDGDQKFLMKRENNYEFVRVANNEISNIELIKSEINEGYIQGILLFESFEKELFDHLLPDMTWRSAMYDRNQFM